MCKYNKFLNSCRPEGDPQVHPQAGEHRRGGRSQPCGGTGRQSRRLPFHRLHPQHPKPDGGSDFRTHKERYKGESLNRKDEVWREKHSKKI